MKSLVEIAGPVQHVNIIRHLIAEDDLFPNNGHLPLLVYRKALHLPDGDRGKIVAELFESNGWVNSWEDGIYDYHHYHSTAHEVLGIINGTGRIQFGGPSGVSLLLDEGDVVVIPAGVAHKNISGSDDLVCVGAYPEGQRYDINTGKPEEKQKAEQSIRDVALPETDPIYGVSGPLVKNWQVEPDRIDEVL